MRRLRIERLDYQAQLAQRRYEEVDPSHRLVAATLEQRWNQALEEAQRLKDDYQNSRQQQGLELTGKPVALFLQFFRRLIQPLFHSLRLDPRKALPIDSATPAIGSAAAPGSQQHIFPVDLVVQCVKAVGRICLRSRRCSRCSLHAQPSAFALKSQARRPHCPFRGLLSVHSIMV